MFAHYPKVTLIGGFGGVPGSTSCSHAVGRGSIPGADDTRARGEHDAHSVLDLGLPGTRLDASVFIAFYPWDVRLRSAGGSPLLRFLWRLTC